MSNIIAQFSMNLLTGVTGVTGFSFLQMNIAKDMIRGPFFSSFFFCSMEEGKKKADVVFKELNLDRTYWLF